MRVTRILISTLKYIDRKNTHNSIKIYRVRARIILAININLLMKVKLQVKSLQRRIEDCNNLFDTL